MRRPPHSGSWVSVPDAGGRAQSAGIGGTPSSNGHRSPASADVMQRLTELLRSEGGLIASLLGEDGRAQRPSAPDPAPADPVPADPASTHPRPPAQLAALGPRASAHPAEYELLLEAIYEGYLLHYATPRVVRAPEADLALLAGDQLYALGLARLVSLGDTAAVTELADVITLCSLAHGAGCPDLAEAAWQAGARAIGWGPSSAHARAKALARAGSAEALAAMRAAAAPQP
jgi:hypothetical protein